MKGSNLPKRLLSSEEAAEYLGLSVKTLYSMTGPRAKKRLPLRVKRIGKLLKFDRKDLDAYIDSL